MRRNVMRDAITGELDRFRVAWSERSGGKHSKIVIPGRGFITFSRGGHKTDGVITRAVRAQVRRILKEFPTLSGRGAVPEQPQKMRPLE